MPRKAAGVLDRLDPDYDIAKERLEDVERILADEKVMRTEPEGSSSGE